MSMITRTRAVEMEGKRTWERLDREGREYEREVKYWMYVTLESKHGILWNAFVSLIMGMIYLMMHIPTHASCNRYKHRSRGWES